jgi:lipoprotein-releasing system permease protein
MNLPLFIAQRIYSDNSDKKRVSRPAIKIATVGVAIGLAVMIITVCIVMGFKGSIRDKVVGFGSHIVVENFLGLQSTDPYPICMNGPEMDILRAVKGVKHVQRFAYKPGILKTNSDFMGIIIKGIGPEYDESFLKKNLIEGGIPKFNDDKSTYKLLISKVMADALSLKTGDKVYAYFISKKDVKARKFTVCGIYQSNMAQYDRSLCFTDLYTTVKLNGWMPDQASGAEITVNDFDHLNEPYDIITQNVNRQADKYGDTYTSQTILEAHEQVFAWLSLLDINVWIILALMICVAGFTMISGLLIIILERTNMIGILKALGAKNRTVRKTFLWFSVMIIGKGLLWGNIIGIGLVVLQKYTGLVKLDPQTYYVDTVPVQISIPIIILLNVATLIISVFVLIAPSYMISHIHPSKSMRYE